MNKRGFSLIEMLVVMIIVSLLLILALPAIVNVYTSVKRNNFTSKVTYIETNVLKYANEYKDDIKNQTCVDYTIDEMIKKGILASDSKGKDEILNPTSGAPMNGRIRACYCKNKLDLSVNYVEDYNATIYYHKGDKVLYNNNIYNCIKDAEPNKVSDTNYFKILDCNN